MSRAGSHFLRCLFFMWQSVSIIRKTLRVYAIHNRIDIYICFVFFYVFFFSFFSFFRRNVFVSPATVYCLRSSRGCSVHRRPMRNSRITNLLPLSLSNFANALTHQPPISVVHIRLMYWNWMRTDSGTAAETMEYERTMYSVDSQKKMTSPCVGSGRNFYSDHF